MAWRFAGPALILLLLVVPAVTANSFVRHYEATSTYAYRDGHLGGAMCMGGHDTIFDTGACVPYYVPGVLDFRGTSLVVSVQDTVFGPDTWLIAVVDMDGNGQSDCDGPDLCFQGQGAAVGNVPSDAGGRYVRAFPATLHTDGLGGIPDGFATRGTVTFTFT